MELSDFQEAGYDTDAWRDTLRSTFENFPDQTRRRLVPVGQMVLAGDNFYNHALKEWSSDPRQGQTVESRWEPSWRHVNCPGSSICPVCPRR